MYSVVVDASNDNDIFCCSKLQRVAHAQVLSIRS
jgi:hypothetical protein